MDPDIHVAVLRRPEAAADLGDVEGLVDEAFFDLADALRWGPDTVFITNPAPFHMETALSFAKNGIHLFVEKPLSVRVDDIAPVLRECGRKDLVLMVGYVLRFLEPFQCMRKAIAEGKIGRILSVHASVGRYLPDWRPGSDYRKNVSARRELGGGAVFELSHEIDYLRWMVGEVKEVNAFISKVSDFDIDVEDIAEINLRFDNKAVGHIHLDMVDRAMNRFCRIVGTEGTLTWDSNDSHRVRMYCGKDGLWRDLREAGPMDPNQMYISELTHFFECVRGNGRPAVTGEDGRRVVEIALAVKRSAHEGRNVKV
jgi:predicted dehydrogenase